MPRFGRDAAEHRPVVLVNVILVDNLLAEHFLQHILEGYDADRPTRGERAAGDEGRAVGPGTHPGVVLWELKLLHHEEVLLPLLAARERRVEVVVGGARDDPRPLGIELVDHGGERAAALETEA